MAVGFICNAFFASVLFCGWMGGVCSNFVPWVVAPRVRRTKHARTDAVFQLIGGGSADTVEFIVV